MRSDDFKGNEGAVDTMVTVMLGMSTPQWLEEQVLSVLHLLQWWILDLCGQKELLHPDVQCLWGQCSYRQNWGAAVIQFSQFNVVVSAPMFVSCLGMKNHQFLLWENPQCCPKHFPIFIHSRGTYTEAYEFKVLTTDISHLESIFISMFLSKYWF